MSICISSEILWRDLLWLCRWKMIPISDIDTDGKWFRWVILKLRFVLTDIRPCKSLIDSGDIRVSFTWHIITLCIIIICEDVIFLWDLWLMCWILYHDWCILDGLLLFNYVPCELWIVRLDLFSMQVVVCESLIWMKGVLVFYLLYLMFSVLLDEFCVVWYSLLASTLV